MGRNGILSMGALGPVQSSYFFPDGFKWRCHVSRNDVAKSSVCLAVVLVAQSILFTNLFDRDNCFRHIRSSRSDLRVNPRLHRNGSQEPRTVNCGRRTETGSNHVSKSLFRSTKVPNADTQKEQNNDQR